MTYKNPYHRIRLNKTETVTLMEATRHALQCWTKRCDECAKIDAYLRSLERVIEKRGA